jgi:hypothetical protein
MSLLAQDPTVPVVSVCDIRHGAFEPYTEVVVEGRYDSDFHHWFVLTSDDCMIQIGVPLDLDGAQAEEFASATRDRDVFRESNVTLRLRGRVVMYSAPYDGRLDPGLAVSEVLEVSVSEAAGE